MTQLNVWAPLAVALAVAAITAVGGYGAARHTTSKAARAELLAVKRKAYADFITAMDNAWAFTRYGPDGEHATISRGMAEGLAQVELLGSADVVRVLEEVKRTTDEPPFYPNFWRKEHRYKVIEAMRQDLRNNEQELSWTRGAIRSLTSS